MMEQKIRELKQEDQVLENQTQENQALEDQAQKDPKQRNKKEMDLQQEIVSRILKLFGDHARFLEPGRNPREALPSLDEAADLAEQLSGEAGGSLRSLVAMHKEHASAMAELRENAEIVSIQRHFRSALEHINDIQKRYPNIGEEFDKPIQMTRTGIEMQLRNLDSFAKRTIDESPAEASARRRLLINDMLATLSPDDPNRDYFMGLLDFNDAIGLFLESSRALSTMSLEESDRYIDKASEVLSNVETLWKDATTGFHRVMLPIVRGYKMLVDAQRAYVKTLKDAIIGDLDNRQVKALAVADEQLMEGLKNIETWGPRAAEFLPNSDDSFNIAGLRSTVTFQREILRSLKALVKDGTQAKQIFLRATPRFLVYFVVCFLVILFGSQWSTKVPSLDVTSVASIALIVSTFSAYGFDAGKQMFFAGWPGKKNK